MEEIYRVVKIIDMKNIIINAGKDNYIKKGDKFEIFIKGEVVFDPITKKSLGSLDTVKETVTVVTVLPNMCVCQKAVKRRFPYVTMSGDSILDNELSSLNVDKSQVTGGFSNDLVIKIGDLARLVE